MVVFLIQYLYVFLPYSLFEEYSSHIDQYGFKFTIFLEHNLYFLRV